ncbi:NAD-dependent epimerase/dehydratase family protein [Paenibacillus sp. 1P03SA]|uniref:NAD-dependent epimerase/dehydratase family protein n=1 Tax=Paenibacillus sp. 1P03SA TaxID=3132294 RepID=UPI0039A3B133
MSRILITGAAGFTGRAAWDYFAAKGYEVAAVVRGAGSRQGKPVRAEVPDGKPDGGAEPVPERTEAHGEPHAAGGPGKAHADHPPDAFRAPQAQYSAGRPGSMPAGTLHACDLTRQEDVLALVAEVEPDWVLHLAGRNSVAESWEAPAAFLQANLMASVYLLEALRTRPGTRILIAGSMLGAAEPGEPLPHPYGFSKMLLLYAARSWHRWFSQQIMVALPSNLVGPGPSGGICGLLARKIAALEKGGPPDAFRLSSLGEERDYLDVRDAVSAYETILGRGEPGAVYRIGSERLRPLGEIVSVFRSLTPAALPLEVENKPRPEPVRPVDVSALKALGWSARIPFETSLADALDYYRRN